MEERASADSKIRIIICTLVDCFVQESVFSRITSYFYIYLSLLVFYLREIDIFSKS